MTYRAAVNDYRFLIDHLLDADALRQTELFSEATEDVTAAILSEAGKMCDEVLAPLQRPGDLHPARLENGVVRTSPGFNEGFRAIADGGWIGMSADPEYGGMGLPMILTSAVNEMMSGACLSLQLAPMLTQGQIEALEHHASDALKAMYLPKLTSGEWTGTMNLTEPQAGSDVGALKSKAVDNGDGTYAVTGQKIYITWGDHDVAENICHLVLARIPGAPEGTKGISLFLVPKFIPNEDGTVGPRNGVSTVSLEHKLGLHGSPTAVMQYDDATGWLVGPEQGGMAAMFSMMNNARLGVGTQGIGVAEAAFQHALSYALDRKQGRTPNEPSGSIIGHADVRRMLSTMKAEIFAARAIAINCAYAIDRANAEKDAAWSARAALLTPIAKAFGTDVGIKMADMGVQVHGGMGFVEETGAAQFLRDVRVTSIYEGTNGIQAMDLVARKMMDGGEAAMALFDEMEEEVEAARARFPRMSEAVWQSIESMREATEWLVAQSDMNDRFAGAVPYLMGFARVLGGQLHLKAAMADPDGPRAHLARFYIHWLLPEHEGMLVQAQTGDETLYAITPEALSA
ncbi:Acyl-CoA dehydrogenase-like protein [Sulfitobacter noctilucae]|uniref:acyl-CoA dehydrogenase n=1 Tax=Sulfitobacter noctilucae TaxID=1342302 RepID=UPI00046938CF|nr:acyl-CoA dehydrogenase [Sulfitobacter noctilucae]KIN70722.1 Acyl-CoA dehydrogenase-like protein [Sulfitobacter noctilucae]